MKFPHRLLSMLAAVACLAMAHEPKVSVRFYAEANARDGAPFSKPITLHFPQRETYIQRIPAVTEANFKAVHPFQTPDGSWGASFKLDELGRINLESVSTDRRGSSMVVFVATKFGARQVIDMLIDKPIRDGIISIPRGLTEVEIGIMTKEFPVWKSAVRPPG